MPGFLITTLVGLLISSSIAFADVSADYIKQALQGDLSNIEETLRANATTAEDKELLEKFTARFIERSDSLDLEGEDPLIREVGELFQDYWRGALLDPSQKDTLEKILFGEVIKALQKNGVTSPDWNLKNLGNLLHTAFEERGYFANFGRTRPLFEFVVWKTNEKEMENVELTDGVQKVEVNYLGDFVSLGWSSFATFGGPSTGGWATDDGLFLVTDKWDLDSESFKVSFLKHEAQHFADYKIYPKLKGPDLEYRAKLTEISFSDVSMYDLLKKFTDRAARVENAPHPLANWHVITDLSRELLDANWPADPGVWKDIPVEDIQAVAQKLLNLHAQSLATAGAETTTGIITP